MKYWGLFVLVFSAMAQAADSASTPSPNNQDAHLAGEFVDIPGTKYRVGKYEVTRGQWAAYAAATGRSKTGECIHGFLVKSADGWDVEGRPVTWDAPGFVQTDKHPVVCVSYDEVQAYIVWLNETLKPAKPFRLPTEKEWEYAARGGVKTRFPWGNRSGTGHAQCQVCWFDHSVKRLYDETYPVGSFPPNNYGLFDVIGNVEEWTTGCWDKGCSKHVRRGGHWDSQQDSDLTITNRNEAQPTDAPRRTYTGFRLVQDR